MAAVPAPSGQASVDRYLKARQAPSTRRAYDACLRQVGLWTAARGETPLPLSADQTALFLAEKADGGMALTTLRRYAAAVGDAHRARSMPDPTATPLIADVLAGIARTVRKVSTRKAALSLAELKAMVDALPDTLLGLRDRAILLFGFASALRRSELAALQVDDLSFGADGVEVLIRRSKADQVCEGQRIFVARGGELCPVSVLEGWLEVSKIKDGALFRRVSHADRLQRIPLQGQAIAGIVHRAAQGAGLDPKRFAGHSLRSGFATTAAAKGMSTWSILAVTRHRSVGALKPYVRSDRVQEFSAATSIL